MELIYVIYANKDEEKENKEVNRKISEEEKIHIYIVNIHLNFCYFLNRIKENLVNYTSYFVAFDNYDYDDVINFNNRL